MIILEYTNIQNRILWLKYWNLTSPKEIYANPEYVNLYSNDNAKACCLVYHSDFGSVMYPVLVRDIDDVYKDIINPYGYGGPIFWNVSDIDLLTKDFYTELKQWAISNNVVSEFIQCYINLPVSDNYTGVNEYCKDHISVDLQCSEEDLWHSFKPKVRKNVKRAIKNNLTIKIDEDGDYLQGFMDIYFSTMERRNAKEYFYLKKKYFDLLITNLKGQFCFFHVFLDDVMVSTELVLVSDNNLYSFLGGTIEEYFKYRPNDFLKYEVMKWGIKNKKSSFILGGGYTPNDGIYSYKLSFAPNGECPFYTEKQIFIKDEYDRLVKKRKDKDSDFDENSKFFPLYRM